MKRFRVGWWDDRHDEEVFRITLEAEDESDAEKKFYEIVENDPDIDNYDDEYPFLCEEIEPDDEYYDDLYDEDEQEDLKYFINEDNIETVFVVVEGGRVVEAFSSNHDIEQVYVLDLDTQDDGYLNKVKNRIKQVKKKITEVSVCQE